MVICVVVRIGGTNGHTTVGGVIGVGKGIAETLTDTTLDAIVGERALTVKQTLSRLIVGVVEDSIAGCFGTEGSAGTIDGFSIVVQRTLVQAHPAATGRIIETESSC